MQEVIAADQDEDEEEVEVIANKMTLEMKRDLETSPR